MTQDTSKRVRWLGDERWVPGIGVIAHGDEVSMPRATADDFARQGLAEPVRKRAAKAAEPDPGDLDDSQKAPGGDE